MKSTHIRMDEQQERLVRAHAQQYGMTFSDTIRDLLHSALKADQDPRVARSDAPCATPQFLTGEQPVTEEQQDAYGKADDSFKKVFYGRRYDDPEQEPGDQMTIMEWIAKSKERLVDATATYQRGKKGL